MNRLKQKKTARILILVMLVTTILSGFDTFGGLTRAMADDGGKQTIDYSFNDISGGGYGAGHSGEVKRFQTFTSTKSGKMNAVSVTLNSRIDLVNGPALQDLIVEIYNVENNKPAGAPIHTVTIPKAQVNINNGNATVVDLSEANINLIEQNKYAVALTQPTTAHDGGTGEHYRWPTANVAAAASETFGKYTADGNWIIENLGAGWLKVEIDGALSVDYSFLVDPPGSLFGVNGWVENRFQTFVPLNEVDLESIDLLLYKRNVPSDNNPYPDVTASVYATDNNGIPVGEALGSAIIASDSIISGQSFNAPLSVKGLEAGIRYAVVLGVTHKGERYASNLYTWPRKNYTYDQYAGVYMNNSYTQYANLLHWVKINMIQKASQPQISEIDMSFPDPGSGGLGCGTNDEIYRYTTFTADKSGTLEKVDLFLNKRYEAQPYAGGISDLIVEIYEVGTDNLPMGDPLKTVQYDKNNLTFTIPTSGDNAVGGMFSIAVGCQGIETGKKYAVAVSQFNLAPNGLTGEHYRWPFRNMGSGEFGGKKTSGGWVDETQYIGTGWMKVTLSTGTSNESRPRTIQMSPSGTVSLSVGEKLIPTVNVLDQYGQSMPNVGLGWVSDNPAIAAVSSAGEITAMAEGRARIRVTAGHITSTLYIESYVSEPKKIVGTANLAVKLGESAALDMNIMDQLKNLIGSLKSKITYVSSDTTVASVSADGTVCGLSAGNTIITASYEKLIKKISVNVYKDSESLIEPVPGMEIRTNVKFKPGVYDFRGAGGIKIAADNITVDGNGATLIGLTNGSFSGTGVYSAGYDNVTVKNLNAHGFNTGIHIENADNWVIEYCDFSDNFTDPKYGWGDGNPYGAVRLTHVNNSAIRYNNGSNVWNGLNLQYGNSNEVHHNDFGITSNVSLKMWNASYNRIYDNNFSWGLRKDPGETHARDSTSSLIESGSNYNYIARNDFSHGGDGIFIRVLNGWCSIGNHFEENDTSWANNNAVESWSPGNVYVRNIANYSSYGFWLGGSDFTYLIDNVVKYNGGYGGRGMQNAPEAFGNAGVSVVNGASSHFYMSGNDIQYNNGPGVAIRYNTDYPAYHWIVQQNTIRNNQNDPRGYRGYGIYLKNAKWVDIMGNDISDNGDVPVKIDANTSDIFVKDTSVGDIKAPKIQAKVTPAVNIGQQEIEAAKIPTEIKNNPFGVVKVQYVTVKAGTELTFDASGSIDPNGLKLTHRWDFGDGYVDLGEKIKHTFTKQGFYRVGVTAKNGILGDLAGFIVNVIGEEQELGTDSLDNWHLVSDTAALSFDTGKHAVGNGAIMVDATSGQDHKLIYSTNKKDKADFSKFDTMSFLVDYSAENAGNSNYKRPVIRLKVDESNYYEFNPVNSYLERLHASISEYRYGFELLSINYTGTDSKWSKNIVGAPTLAGIKQIEIVEGPSASGISHFSIDGLKLSKASNNVDLSVNLAKNQIRSGKPEPISSEAAQGSDPWAPLKEVDVNNPGMLLKWISSGIGTEAWYGVDFGTDRYINKLEVYFYYNPTGDATLDTIIKPKSFKAQYWDGSAWRNIKKAEYTSKVPSANYNAVLFDLVKASKVRIVVEAEEGKSIGIYAFRVRNTANYAANSYGEAMPVRSVSTSTAAKPALKQIGVLLNKRDNPGADLTDLVVDLYETEGKTVKGSPIKSVTVPITEVKFGEETVVNIDYPDLVPGVRYAIAVSQKTPAPNGGTGDHFLWPTANTGFDEYYGKINNGNGIYEALGTGWLKVYTDKTLIDFSHGNRNGGFGAGHGDEQKRYQTFTVPEDTGWNLIDGSIAEDNGWETQIGQNTEQWAEIDLGEVVEFDTIALYLRENDMVKLPISLKAEYYANNKWNVIRAYQSSAIKQNLILDFKKVKASKVRISVISAQDSVAGIKEVEVIDKSYKHKKCSDK